MQSSAADLARFERFCVGDALARELDGPIELVRRVCGPRPRHLRDVHEPRRLVAHPHHSHFESGARRIRKGSLQKQEKEKGEPHFTL